MAEVYSSDVDIQIPDEIYSSDDDVQIPDVMVDDIPVCEGIPRRLWNTRCVIIQNEEGLPVAEGICHSVSFDLVFGSHGPLGDTHVGILITRSLSEADIPREWCHSLLAWPIHLVFCNGASLFDHEVRDNYNRRQANASRPLSLRPSRSYTITNRNPPRESSTKIKQLLTLESILAVSSKVCCKKNCVQLFHRDKVQVYRERMYRETSFQFRFHMKVDIHRQIHHDSRGKKVVTIEGEDVCLRTWMFIAGVSEATFYRYQSYAAQGRQAHPHGNSGVPKPRTHTTQAIATLGCILEKTADYMPHRTRTLESGKKVVSMILPATFQWKDTISEINTMNATFGLKEVSTSNLSKIRKVNFLEYDVKRPGDNFARCSTCDRFHSLRRGAVVGSQQALLWAKKLDKHLTLARAHRELYYANRYQSSFFPHECLTIMHDKMDHAKTASPVFSHKSKELDGLFKLPVSVTGMLAHGHGDVRYAHYGLDLFAHDSNYTIGSFAKLLRDLELPPKSTSRELFVGSRSSALFDAVLKGAEICEASLPTSPNIPAAATLLPPIMNV